MKIKLVAVALGLVMSTAINAADALNTDLDKLSYSIGSDLGKNFKSQGIEVNPTVLAEGIKDGMSGSALKLTDEQMKDVLNKFQKDLMEKRTAEFNKKAEENKVKGEAFLAKNKAKEGVVTLADGLQYKIIKNGTGAKPGKDDNVTVEYKGTLISGEVFDIECQKPVKSKKKL